MLQSEIWYADLDPVKGSEQNGFLPVVIISGNLMNEYHSTVICCPLSTKVKNYKGNVVLIPNLVNKLKQPSEILTAHVRSISKEKLIRKIGSIEAAQLLQLKEGLSDMLRY